MRYKTKKSIVSLLVFLLLIGLSVGVSATDASIVFKGQSAGFEFSPGSAYAGSDLFADFKDLMPGDQLTQTIHFTNQATDSDYIKLYMKMLPHGDDPVSAKVAETETGKTMKGFLSYLSLRVWNGTDLIYNQPPSGTGPLTDYVPLGTFQPGESATLKADIYVPSTLGNNFANRAGEVRWSFLAEGFNLDQLTVRKVWSDGNDKHDSESVIVKLLKDGIVEDNVELNAANQWTHTFNQLDGQYNWTVEEDPVPAGYTASTVTNGNEVTITNVKEPSPEELTVVKVWSDGNDQHDKDSVTVNLLKDGVKEESVELNLANQWTHTFIDLDPAFDWTVEELDVAGYKASYVVEAAVVTITNQKEIPPVELSVKKVWSDSGKNRPSSVSVGLYNGNTLQDTVQLSATNNWSHTWKDLAGDGNWQVLEKSIPKGYTPSYSVKDGLVTVTNTATLIQTGQLKWPIPVFGGLGILLVIAGLILVSRKKKERA